MKIRHGNDAVVSGHLDKVGRFSNKRRGFYQLAGTVLSKSKKRNVGSVQWEVDVCGARVAAHGRNGVTLTVGKNVLVLYARDKVDWLRWHTALQVAVVQKLETFYAVGRQIGEGGFAHVYIAQDRATGEVVAVKTVDKGASAQSFLSREVAILKGMDSRFVCSTFDIFETKKSLHLVLEYMKGGSLFDVLDEFHTLPEHQVRAVMRQILGGVLYLHSHGIVHRDLKPENVLLADRGRLDDLRLADFGLSRHQEEGAMMFTMIGTPQFSALEILRDERYGCEVDLWSCGIMCYNMLSGTLPFGVEEVLETYSSGNVTVPYPEEEWASISAGARQFTKQLLCKDQSARLSAFGALCSPWLTQDSEHRWEMFRDGDSVRGDPDAGADVSPSGTSGREAGLLMAAISRQARRRWRSAAICARMLVRIGAVDGASDAGPQRQLQSVRSLASDTSRTDSEWDYSEADCDGLSQVNSFDSGTCEAVLGRASSHATEGGVGSSHEAAAVKRQEDVVFGSETEPRSVSRRQRGPGPSNFARVSMTEGPTSKRGFQKYREGIARTSTAADDESASVNSNSPRSVASGAAVVASPNRREGDPHSSGRSPKRLLSGLKELVKNLHR